jgi:Fe-S-cluster-containing hydrogenase component 2
MKIDQNKCVGCCCCMSSCPQGAITCNNGKCEIDQTKCVNCGSCAALCPMQAIA